MRLEPSDVVVAHVGSASTILGRWLHLPAQRALLFHGDLSGRPEETRRARAQLAAAAEACALTLVSSDAAAEEARAAGHRRVEVMPTFVERSRFDWIRREAPRAGFAVLGVDAPGTRAISTAIAAELRRIGGRWTALAATHEERIAQLRSADVFLAVGSEPPPRLAEAMAAGVPVVAFAVGAAPTVLGGRGIQFDALEPAPVAELCRQVARDPTLTEQVRGGQLARVDELAREAAAVVARLFPRVPSPVRRRGKTRRRIAVVVQRYGDVGGGAEKQARMIAERLSAHVDLEVLTSRARDHLAWDDAFPSGVSEEAGVAVRRFERSHPKDLQAFNAFSRGLFERAGTSDRAAEQRWLYEQGPVLRGLEEHLAQTRYDAILAFTYLYWPTVAAAIGHAERTIVIPEAHPEPAFEFHLYGDVFERVAALLCNTPEEAQLISRRFPRHARTRVVGVGIDAAPSVEPHRFRRKYGVDAPYLLYVGRLERAKGLEELVRFHRALRSRQPQAPVLLLAGSGALGEQLQSPHVRALGRISEQDKYDALAGAVAAVVPSRFESLSLFALEAFSVGAPVIGNARSDVVVGQLERSGAGAAYSTAGTFIDAVDRVLRERDPLGKRGIRFAETHRWDRVVDAYLEEIDRTAKGTR